MKSFSTQKGIQKVAYPIIKTKRYSVNHLDLHLHTARLTGKWYIYWISARTKSLSQNVGAFIFSDKTFTGVYPSKSNQQIPSMISLNDFSNDAGIPDKLKSNQAPEFCE